MQCMILITHEAPAARQINLKAAANLITNLNDKENWHDMPNSLIYAQKLDIIDQYPRTEHVIESWPFLQRWWKELNENH
jgi:hypothetical protein